MSYPDPDPNLDRILAQLRDLSGRYSLEALRREFLEKGYDPATVNRAIQIFMQENRPLHQGCTYIGRTLMVLGINSALVVAFAIDAFEDVMTDEHAFEVLLAVGWLQLLGGIALLVTPKTRSWGIALVCGLLITVAMIILLAKVCRAMFSDI